MGLRLWVVFAMEMDMEGWLVGSFRRVGLKGVCL